MLTKESFLKNVDSLIDEATTKLEAARTIKDGRDYVAAFPGHLLAISHDEKGLPFVDGSTSPDRYDIEEAQRLCNRTTNGAGERPMPQTYVEYLISMIKGLKEVRETFL